MYLALDTPGPAIRALALPNAEMPTKLLSMSRLSPSSVARGERDEYEGERDAAGRPHGKGGQLYANGNQYDGAWDAGVRHGHGIQTWTNGDKYDGYWNAGVQHCTDTAFSSAQMVINTREHGRQECDTDTAFAHGQMASLTRESGVME